MIDNKLKKLGHIELAVNQVKAQVTAVEQKTENTFCKIIGGRKSI